MDVVDANSEATSSAAKVCVPGERLFKASSDDGSVRYAAGNGTYVRHGHVYAALVGVLQLREPESDIEATVVEVRRETAKQHAVPFPGAVVTAKIVALSSRFCKCSILCVESAILANSFQGLIRKEDVRATEKDKVEMQECFRPGDIVLAKVLSLGDAQAYLLTTAEEELGVVLASCTEGHKMTPVSFEKMHCSVCSTREQRKLAKVPHRQRERVGGVTTNG